MQKVIAEFTMSLDGFIAAPNDDIRPIFGWYTSGDTEFQITPDAPAFKMSPASAELLRREWDGLGALVTGRRDFDVSRAWGGTSPMGVPIFIVTHSPPPEWTDKSSPFTFVTEGVERALDLARQTAGAKNVGVGGTKIVQQCLQARLIDEIQIHLVPILLGAGIRLFDNLGAEPIALERTEVIEGMDVTHLRFRVVK